jgi:hypothetical protein
VDARGINEFLCKENLKIKNKKKPFVFFAITPFKPLNIAQVNPSDLERSPQRNHSSRAISRNDRPNDFKLCDSALSLGLINILELQRNRPRDE